MWTGKFRALKRSGILVGLLLLAACGSGDSPLITGGGSTSVITSGAGATVGTTATTALPRIYAGELTSSDGNRYLIEVAVGQKAASVAADECPPAAPPPGTVTVPVSLVVRNVAADRTVPFPPVRIELTGQGQAQAAPQKVLVKDPSGTCTSTPRVPQIGPGERLVFRGTSPSIAADAGPGTAGRIEVSVSETRFSLTAPVP